MPAVLRNLKINRVASVDKGAGEGVKIVFWKRDAPRELSDEVVAYLKREFSEDKRKELAGKGHALPDGSFPIENTGDLSNAIQAIGRAKDPAKAKAHIKARAQALGASDKIPETWGKRYDGQIVLDSMHKALTLMGVAKAVRTAIEKNGIGYTVQQAEAPGGPVHVMGGEITAADFNEVVAEYELAEDANALLCCVRDALCALDCSIASILGDDDVTDAEKPAMIEQSFEQFIAHLGELGLEEIGKALAGAKGATKMSGTGVTVTNKDLAALIEKTANEAIAKATAPLLAEIAVLKMSDKHKAHHDSLPSQDAKDKFKAMSPDERDAHMEKTKKSLETPAPGVEAAVAKVLEPVLKQLGDIASAVSGITGERRTLAVNKRVGEMGLDVAKYGPILLKAELGDAAARAEYDTAVQQRMKALSEQARTGRAVGGLFTELGKGTEGSGAVTAYDELMAKANALVGEVAKDAKAKPLSAAQAFTKVYTDPANRELADRYRVEHRQRLSGSRAA